MVEENLIFDLGLHNGDDTDYYLTKGFNVVSVEADPELVEIATERFDQYIYTGQLVLINQAISNSVGNIEFFIHPIKKDWSSCYRELAESDGNASNKIEIPSTTILELCKEYGVPRYIKVDVEGCDLMVAEQLYKMDVKPKFVSFETSKKDYAGIFSWLYVSGYSKFQLVNQALNMEREMPHKSSEGGRVDYKFSKYSSGFFGEDLPDEKWLSYDEALSRYQKYKELKMLDNKELGLGWLDVHARLAC